MSNSSGAAAPPDLRSMETYSSASAADEQPMAAIENNHNNDVLCGRGVTTNRHPGNEKFRALVSANKELYVSSTKRQKMAISRSIVEAVRARCPAGRFLEKDIDTGLWYDIGDKKAIEKTSQALRDGAASLRKQLSDDMSDPNFLEAVFDGVDPSEAGVEKCRGKRKESKEGTKKEGPGHRRTNSSPAVTGRSSGIMKRKNPPCDKSTSEVLSSDEKSQKEALKRMTSSPSGAAVTPFRPDRRPTSHRHKRTVSAGSVPTGRLFSRETPPGCPYPRQTPPSSPNPYMRPSPPPSPYGYSVSPFPYHCPPTPPSPAYGYSRSYSWGSEHGPPPSPSSPHHRVPPPPRQNSDPSPIKSPSGYALGPPSPVAYATRRSPPTYLHPHFPRKGYHHTVAPGGWPSPRPYHGHGAPSAHPPLSPSPSSHHQQQAPPPPPAYSPYQQSSLGQQYCDEEQHSFQHQHHQQYPSSPRRVGYPPLSPRTSDPGVDDDHPGPPMLSIPTLNQENQDQASKGEMQGLDESDMPPPKWYRSRQIPPQSPRSRPDIARFSPPKPPPLPPSRDASWLRSDQASSSAATKQYLSPRSMLLPSRLHDDNPSVSEGDSQSKNLASVFKETSGQEDMKQHRPTKSDAENAAPSLEVSPEGSLDDVDEVSPPPPPPPPEICKSFTFVDGQLMENDEPVMTKASPKTMMTDPKTFISNPSDSPNTPKAVNAVERFEVENVDNGKEVNFGPTGVRPRMSSPAKDKPEDPAMPELPSSKEDGMLILDDGSLSPLPFDEADIANEDSLIDIGEHMYLFSPPCSSPTRELDTFFK